MHKIRTLTDLRKQLQLERYDRKNTKVYVRIDDSVVPITGVELGTEGGDYGGRMAVYFTVEDGTTQNDVIDSLDAWRKTPAAALINFNKLKEAVNAVSEQKIV